MIEELDWLLEYSDDIAFYKELQEEGLKSPLDVMPVYTFESAWFQETFKKLSLTRGSNGFGLNPIPYTEYIAYFSFNKPIYDLNFVIDILVAMDKKFLSVGVNSNVETRTEDNTSGGRG